MKRLIAVGLMLSSVSAWADDFECTRQTAALAKKYNSTDSGYESALSSVRFDAGLIQLKHAGVCPLLDERILLNNMKTSCASAVDFQAADSPLTRYCAAAEKQLQSFANSEAPT